MREHVALLNPLHAEENAELDAIESTWYVFRNLGGASVAELQSRGEHFRRAARPQGSELNLLGQT